ncbi:MAG: L,D-transpeptidase [Merismopedia sp. SIO2A8]|nr:L,D-transpeptidase [Symploca sp. SIO2B6]NET47647.1 L,D-transpeptidase [Merismopedia sp. SIO2A8]
MWVNINLQSITAGGCFTVAVLLVTYSPASKNSDIAYCPCLKLAQHPSQLQSALSQSKIIATPTLYVSLSEKVVRLVSNGTTKAEFPIAIGKPGWETPTGDYYIDDMQQYPFWKHPITSEIIPPGGDNPMGSRWIRFHTTADGLIGFHGTNTTASIGTAASHGCLRMYNHDIEHLYQQVTIGMKVVIR